MKIAASLDGQTALANGQSQWITGEAARADGHAWRARAGAVLTGIGTVLETTPAGRAAGAVRSSRPGGGGQPPADAAGRRPVRVPQRPCWIYARERTPRRRRAWRRAAPR
jgi:diaminohydroxyphosphoribosylaminopyrimidine deaminase/5-amino-6-(5-phosphoribosylamino)uracil reductase